MGSVSGADLQRAGRSVDEWQSSVNPVVGMKTTLKLDLLRSLVIEPDKRGVRLSIKVGSIEAGFFVLTPDQVGAALFGLEQAAEAAGIAKDPAAL